HKKLPRRAGTCGYFLLFHGQHNGRVPHSRLLKVAGARDSFTYQSTDMPLLSTFYEPLSKQLISVLAGLPYPVLRRMSNPAVGVLHRPRPCSGVLRRVRAARASPPEARHVCRRVALVCSRVHAPETAAQKAF